MQTTTATVSTERNPISRKATPSGHVIERGIPIPELLPVWQRGKGAGRSRKLDLSPLSVSESVFLAAKTKAAVARSRANALAAAKRADIKITARTVEGGLRIWRTA